MARKKVLFGAVVTAILMVVIESIAWGWERFSWLGDQIAQDASLYVENDGGRPQLRPELIENFFSHR